MTFFCNTSQVPTNPKARSYDFYLDKIRDLGFEFDVLEAYCTDGDIRPPYRYQWLAKTKRRAGDDDPCEGFGASPLEALCDLHKNAKTWADYEPDEDL